MKKVLGICLIFFLSIQTSKADMIDFWCVYLNGKKIREFKAYSEDLTIRLKLSEVKPEDSIRVDYFRDTPCSDCPPFLAITDTGGVHTTIATGNGTLNPLSFSLKALLDYKTKMHKDSFWVFYYEGKSQIPMFEIGFK